MENGKNDRQDNMVTEGDPDKTQSRIQNIMRGYRKTGWNEAKIQANDRKKRRSL
jgi:hypothetical protein